MPSERAEKWMMKNKFRDAHVRHEMNQVIADHLGQDANSKSVLQMIDDAIRERVRAAVAEAVRECDRHALFLKHEIENGGNYEHLKARQDEAEYLAGKIRALVVTP